MRATWNVLFILGMFTNVLGAQSYLVNYQGQLTDAQGQPLATKGYKLDLRIWDAPNGGAQLWHKTFVNTQVVNGQFNVVLGADDSGVSIADVLYGGDRYLEIEVDDGAPILPRQQMMSAPLAVVAANGTLPGTVIAYAGASVPAGYLLCDGSQVSRATYSNLYTAIGNFWGAGDGNNTFHLPDLQGRFLRGVDMGAGRDPDGGSRGASGPGGNTGD